MAVGAAAAAAAAYLWSRPMGPASPSNRKLQGYALTLTQLATYDGRDASKPTLLAIRNQVGRLGRRCKAIVLLPGLSCPLPEVSPLSRLCL